jgi:hypothetical protein
MSLKRAGYVRLTAFCLTAETDFAEEKKKERTVEPALMTANVLDGIAEGDVAETEFVQLKKLLTAVR